MDKEVFYEYLSQEALDNLKDVNAQLQIIVEAEKEINRLIPDFGQMLFFEPITEENNG